jgi:error-prone DNA polymerase
MTAGYVELHARSAFSFLRGSSRPEELAKVAAHLGLPAVAVCDRDGVYGAPLLFKAAGDAGVRAIVGAELTLEGEAVLPVLVESRRGYENLCRLLTRAHLRSPKGESRVRWDELPEFAEGLVALTGDEEGPLVRAIRSEWNGKGSGSGRESGTREVRPSNVNGESGTRGTRPSDGNEGESGTRGTRPSRVLENLEHAFGGGNVFVEIQRHHWRGEERVNRALMELAEQHRMPLLATNGVLHAQRCGRQILDVFTCLRHHTHLDAAGRLLSPNTERHLKSAAQMQVLFGDCPQALENTVCLAERLEFTLNNLGYAFPTYAVPAGHSMDSWLREQAFAGARKRYQGTIPEKVRRQLNDELKLIESFGVAGYFLIVWDMVEFCREQKIMAQGRGSAANSTTCYCLGITNVDPLRFNTLFERFLSEGRRGCWPDIDIDLPSGERRERVIQEVYRRYGRNGAAMTANVITYRGRSAAREIGKVLNIGPDVLDRFSALFANGDFPHTMDLSAQMQQSGLPQEHPRAQAFVTLYQQMQLLPRHLGQHSGGIIVCQGRLDSIVPLENASMPGRVVAQWDKDDCERLGIIKVDLLGLGMMSVLQDAVELTRRRGHPVDLAQLPQDDGKTFAMMQAADTIGVFQIESRAQMATLPRMKPDCFYDVCIEVAIIRPGPIQGHLMHPYLARRAGKEPVVYYHPDLEPILSRTLGVPLFQEQMLEMAMKMTDFTASEAEELRRALSFHRSQDEMKAVEGKLRAAMQRKGFAENVIEHVAGAVTSFALYGFPESHAISFAHMAYASAYLKAHYATEFYASLLNNQPMGFYSSATLIQDAHRHGVKFRPVCVARSDWDCTIAEDEAIRLGLRVVRGLHERNAQRLIEERRRAPFVSIDDFKRRVSLSREEMRTLAEIGALNCFSPHRRDALWHVEAIEHDDLFSRTATMSGPSPARAASPLPAMEPLERLRADFAGTQLTVGRHPMALIRDRLPDIWRAADLPRARHGDWLRIAGNVICRQRPGTAKGFVFISLEDETGISNAIVRPDLFEELRLVITEEPFLVIEGVLQNVDHVIHVRAERIERLPHDRLVGSRSYDFH